MSLAHVAWILMWVLVALGVLALLLSPILVLGPLRGLLSRTESLQRAQLAIDLQLLKERGDELSRLPARIEPLLERAKRAKRSLEVSARMFRLPEAVAALRGAGFAVRSLLAVFRGA